MKMRKKLAALLAAAMIASVMPMTAFAASDNRVSKVVRVAEDQLITGSESPTLRVKLKDTMATGESFYLTLDGAFWSTGVKDSSGDYVDSNSAQNTAAIKSIVLEDEASGNKIKGEDFAANGLSVQLNGDDLEIKSTTTPVELDSVFVITLNTVVEDGEATIEIDGHNSTVDSGKYPFAKVSDDYSIDLKVDDADKFSINGDVAEITISEPYKGAFAKNQPVGGNYKIELEFKDSDFTFYEDTKLNDNGEYDSPVKLTGKKGFSGLTVKTDKANTKDGTTNPQGAKIVVGKDTVTITFPDSLVANSAGEFTITNLKVNAKSRSAKGDVQLVARNVDGTMLDGTQTVVVATHAEHATKIEMKKEYEVKTGREVDIEWTLADDIADSLVSGRDIEFSLSKGVKFKEGSVKVKAKNKKDVTDNYGSEVVVDFDKADKFNSFEITDFKVKDGKEAEYKFEATIFVPNNFEGKEVMLKADGRALTETHEVVAAKVVQPVSVEITPMDVKVGLRQQTGGKIVIKENEKEAILRNYTDEGRYTDKDNTTTTGDRTATPFKDAEIHILIDEGVNDGLKITDADIEVTEGDLLLDLDAKVISNGMMIIPVKRQSTKPSTIEITNIEVTANRSVPEGKYDIKVGGNALSKNTELYEFLQDRALKDDIYSGGYNGNYFMDPVAVAEFINITTKNTEDFTGVTSAEVKFVVGSNQYLVNGEAKDMDAAAYVKDGRTMVPVRYVAGALGITEDKIVWEGGAAQTATILADKVIQVKLGSKTMVVNGANVPMTAAAEIKDGRTFVPVAEIARALNVSVNWDEATKTATFNAAK